MDAWGEIHLDDTQMGQWMRRWKRKMKGRRRFPRAGMNDEKRIMKWERGLPRGSGMVVMSKDSGCVWRARRLCITRYDTELSEQGMIPIRGFACTVMS